jgi:HEPN domain-containing protein
MPSDSTSPSEWLRYAQSDLWVAQHPPAEDLLLEALCFHAQQAAEKSIKAVLLHLGVPFPKTHSLEHLVDLLPAGIERVGELADAGRLTPFATVLRYPGAQEPVTEARYREALRLAAAVMAWARQVTGQSAP